MKDFFSRSYNQEKIILDIVRSSDFLEAAHSFKKHESGLNLRCPRVYSTLIFSWALRFVFIQMQSGPTKF